MRSLGALAILVSLSGILLAQDANLQFEVASVRVSSPVPAGTRVIPDVVRGGPGTTDPEHITYERVPFMKLLMYAYGVERDQLNGPDWATTDARAVALSYDISAKLPPGTTKQQAAIMLQNLLKERFQLALHHETVQASGFALVVAKGGPKLKESAGPIAASERNATERGTVNLKTQQDGFPELFPGRNMGGAFQNGTVRMRVRDYSMSDLVQQTSFALNVRMVDKTALTGKYDFTFEFTPPQDAFIVGIGMTLPLAPGQSSPLNKEGMNPGREESVSIISSAMEKQLGLKLEPAKIPIDTLVIDRVEKTPVEN